MNEKTNRAKIIFHIDINAFFCSVACILNPSLRGKVFAIGRENSYRGVITSASYEARKLGIHSAMPQIEAYKKVPDLIIVTLDYEYYKQYHRLFIQLLHQYSDLIEVASIDEVYMDVTELSLKRHPFVVAKEIQMRLLKEIGLPCSIGIAPTLFLAKMASDLKKPLGVTVLRKRDVKQLLYPLSVQEIFGIGKQTYPLLIQHQIKTIADFMNPDYKDKIINLIGKKTYEAIFEEISGNSSNIVEPDRRKNAESISTSFTFSRIIDSTSEVLYELRKMVREIVLKLKEKHYFCKTVSIILRTTTFKTMTRSMTLEDYSNEVTTIFDCVSDLVETHYHQEPLRLIGVGVSHLKSQQDLPKEYNLFTVSAMDVKEERIENLIQTFQEKYGKNALFQKKNRS